MKLNYFLTALFLLVQHHVSSRSRRRDLSLVRIKRESQNYDYITDSEEELLRLNKNKEKETSQISLNTHHLRNERATPENFTLPLRHNNTKFHDATIYNQHLNNRTKAFIEKTKNTQSGINKSSRAQNATHATNHIARFNTSTKATKKRFRLTNQTAVNKIQVNKTNKSTVQSTNITSPHLLAAKTSSITRPIGKRNNSGMSSHISTPNNFSLPIKGNATVKTTAKKSDVPIVDDPIAEMYKQLKERTKNQHVEKRFVEKSKLDPFEKLKEFFDELNKRSVFDDDKEFQPLVKEKRSQLDDVRNKTRHIVVLPTTRSSGSGSGDMGSGNEDDTSGSSFNVTKRNNIVKVTSNHHKNSIDDYTSLLKSKRSIDDDYDFDGSRDNNRAYFAGHVTENIFESYDDENDQNVDEIDDMTGPTFEKIAEKLATDKMIARENPRAKILKNSQKYKSIPDIPLPFNQESSGDGINGKIHDMAETRFSPNKKARKKFQDENVMKNRKNRNKAENLNITERMTNANIPKSPNKLPSEKVLFTFPAYNQTKSILVDHASKSNKAQAQSSVLSSSKKASEKRKAKKPKQAVKGKSDTRINKREVIPDSNPDVDQIMGSDGNVLQEEEPINSNLHLNSVVYEKNSPKLKRHTDFKKPVSFTGIWSGLGTTPEFVPGLIKRDVGSVFEIRNKKHKKMKRNVNKNVITNKENKQVSTENDSDETDDDEPTTLSKRDVILTDDDVNNDNKDSTENLEQSESKQIELGSLGSFNMGKIRREKDALPRSFQKSKRYDKELDINVNSSISEPKTDGKIVYAFDEVKELLPAQKIFNSIGENRLPVPSQSPFKKDISLAPIFTSAQQEIRSEVTEPKKSFDIDKDLADSMILSGDRKNKIPKLEATKIVYEKNLDLDKYLDNDLSDIRSSVPVHLLNNSKKISKAETSQLRGEEVKQKANQIKNWMKDSKSSGEINDAMESEIQTMSDQLAETDNELAKLNRAPYTTGAESAYLAKKLEEKNDPLSISSEEKQKTLEQLENDILKEQENYKMVLKAQHEQFKEQQKQKQKEDELFKQAENNKQLNPVKLEPNVQQINKTVIQINDQKTQPVADESKPYNNNESKNMSTNPTPIPFTLGELIPPQRNVSAALTTTPAPVDISSTVPLLKISATAPIMIKPVKEYNGDNNSIHVDNQLKNESMSLINNESILQLIKQVKENKTMPEKGVGNNEISNTSVMLDVPSNKIPHTQNQTALYKNASSQIFTTLATTVTPQTQTVLTTIVKPSMVTSTLTPPLNQDLTVVNLLLKNNETTENNMVERNKEKNATNLKELPFPLDIAYQPRVVKVTNKTTELDPRSDGYIGCYIDHLEQGRDLPVRAGIPFVTPNNCRSACKRTGYSYAGLQYGYLCFCGNKYGQYDVVPDDQCNNICSGDPNHTCGGLWRNEIYSTERASMEANEGPVPVYIPPKDFELKHTQHDPLIVPKSFIPSAPIQDERYDERIHMGEDSLQSVQTSESDDLKALEQETRAALSKNKVGIMRDIQNLTDDDIINVAKLQQKLDEAAKIDIETTSKNVTNQMASTTQRYNNTIANGSLVDESSRDLLTAFVYLHPQNGRIDDLKKSPVLPLRIEPGTHLFRGEVMLQQPWYDELAKPATSKFKILTGNVEEALKNIFINESAFLKAEVLSLREAGEHIPHKTVVDFTLTFKQNESTHTVTHRLFDAVLSSSKLDQMPVFPHSLRVREYLLDPNAQAFIPKVINGELQIDMSKPISNQNQLVNLNFDTNSTTSNQQYTENMNVLTTTVIAPATTITPPIPILPFKPPDQQPLPPVPPPIYNVPYDGNRYFELNKQIQPQQRPSTLLQSGYIQPKPIEPLPGPDLAITPGQDIQGGPTIVQNQISNNYNGPQQLQQFKNLAAKQQALENQKNLPSSQQKKKVPYILRMFFWKDMLARKKREDIDTKQKSYPKNKIIKFDTINGLKNNKPTSTINMNQKLPRVREKRHQADNWPTSYKKDDEKLSYKVKTPTSLLSRKKRILSENEIEENRKLSIKNIEKDFENILMSPSAKRHKRHPRSLERVKKQTVKKELFTDNGLLSYITNERKYDPEKALKRNKRDETED